MPEICQIILLFLWKAAIFDLKYAKIALLIAIIYPLVNIISTKY